MKKKILILVELVICLSITVAGTLAYYTAEDNAHNVITSGGINIEVEEKMKDADGGLVDFPKEGIHGVMPGTKVSKIVQVENTGSADAWIRISVESIIVGADGEELPLTFGEDDTPVMSFTLLEGWIDGGDGYFYYEQPVAPESMTGMLFETVDFHEDMGNEYQNCTANVIIFAEAVQSANNPIPEGGRVADIAGWPFAE